MPASQRVLSRRIQECNDMQAVEGEIDSAHVRLIKMARDLQDGVEPAEALRPEIYNVRAVDMVCPPTFWLHGPLCR